MRFTSLSAIPLLVMLSSACAFVATRSTSIPSRFSAVASLSSSIQGRSDCWRPTVNDVERISWGKPAKQKGTGSRGVPHRLNSDERELFDVARRHGFLQVPGSAWRSQRREAPLLNTFRSLCDARAQPLIVLHKRSDGIDELVVDLSPMRDPSMFQNVAETCLAMHSTGGKIMEKELPKHDSEGDATNGADNYLDVQDPWASRPIYQLPTYCIVWELPRSEAKSLGKSLAKLFDTAEGNSKSASAERKPVGIKPGKNRRHGGYGIG